MSKKRIAAHLRALAARLDPPPAVTISTGWYCGPFGVVPVNYTTGSCTPKVTYTNGGGL